MTKPLSPTAQAVINAVVAASPRIRDTPPECRPPGGYRSTRLATAIRALVEATLPEDPTTPMLREGYGETMIRWRERQRIRAIQLAAANELEGQS